jgi:hypothetical protein
MIMLHAILFHAQRRRKPVLSTCGGGGGGGGGTSRLRRARKAEHGNVPVDRDEGWRWGEFVGAPINI